MYREDLAFVPPDLIAQLRAAYDGGSVDAFWDAWSTGAESGLAAQLLPVCRPSWVGVRFMLAEPWTRDGTIPQGCPLGMVFFIVALYVPCCFCVWKPCLVSNLSSMRTI